MEIKIMLKSFVVNFLLATIKIIISLLTSSKTILADAVHSLSDMSTDIVALTGAKIVAKKADKLHPFGYGKMEYVTSIFISLFIVSLSILIFINSFSSKEMIYSKYLFFIMPLAIVVKFLLSKYLIKNGKRLNSNILVTSGIESKFNMFNTLFAFLIIIISYFQKYVGILRYADMIGSILISIFTIRMGIRMFLENTKSVIDEIDNDPEKQKAIKELLMQDKRINNVEKISLLKNGTYTSLVVVILMDPDLKLKKIYKEENIIKRKIKKLYKDIKYITVNIKPTK